MSVFQRRLASSTYAVMTSFQRRIEKLDRIIADVQEGRITIEQLLTLRRRMKADMDILESKTADEESFQGDVEENEAAEEKILQHVIAASLSDLLAEKEQVENLLELSRKIYDGYVRQFIRKAAPLTGIAIDGDMNKKFTGFDGVMDKSDPIKEDKKTSHKTRQ